jgi:ubiquitin carboxyl-terminal hydrolase 10
MNGRHLPAGQGMHHEMNRRRQYNQQQYQPPAGMYNGYYNQNFYPQVLPQYQHVGVPQNPYAAPYPPMYGRSPTLPYQQYSMPQPVHASPVYPQPPQPRPHQSPVIVSSPYQPPPPPQTPSSTRSSFTAPAPSTPTYSTPQSTQLSPVQSEAQPVRRPAFQPPVSIVLGSAYITELTIKVKLPWLSRPDLPWPKSNKSRRKRKPAQDLDQIELPTAPNHDQPESEELQQPEQEQDKESSETLESAAASVPRPETPSTNQPASEEAASTTPTTPSSDQQSSQIPTSTAQTTKSLPRPIAVPIIPVIPKISARSSPTVTETSQKSPQEKVVKPAIDDSSPAPAVESEDASKPETEDASLTPGPVAAPKSWANLFKGPAPAVARTIDSAQTSAQNSVSAVSFTKKNIESLSDALVSFNASAKDAKIAFLEPRGLVNTGNMCYMNSVSLHAAIYLPF